MNTEANVPDGPNPFSPLLDAISVLAVCAGSSALRSLPRSARCDADQPSRTISAEMAEHDAAVEADAVEASGKRTTARRTKVSPFGTKSANPMGKESN